tara:strand:- start:1013 stop:2047 length:1035 start_codon:yes stop_codon:yes gene_type:complete
MSKKKQLGQFYTSNYDYILQNLNIADNVNNIVEPFCGQGDLIKFLEKFNKNYNIECYDIDPQNDKLNIIKQDTLLNPPDFNNKFVITNCPFLSRNKSKDKTYYKKYDEDDLYKCFIKILLSNICKGGIIIISLNFLTSIRQKDSNLRKMFLEKYKINKLNIFEEKVFDDTGYTVCAFEFEYNNSINENIPCTIYPSNLNINLKLNEENNYIIGGEIYRLKSDKYKIERLTNRNLTKKHSNLLLKCIDDNINSKICLSYNKDAYIDNTPNLSCRTYATLIISPEINILKQKKIVKEFNNFINKKREDYHSLFLTNFRESKKGFSRKRISFSLAFNIISYLLENLD